MRRNLTNSIVFAAVAGVSTVAFADLGGVPESGVTSEKSASLQHPVLRGDANCDGRVDNFDIDAFIVAMTAEPTYYAKAHPTCNVLNLDADGDGMVTNFDIDAFVALMTGAPVRPSGSTRPLDNSTAVSILAEVKHAEPQVINASGASPLPAEYKVLRGDSNCDGRVDNFDIDPFILAISDSVSYRKLYPTCSLANSDIDGDGRLTNFELDAYIAMVAGRISSK